MKILSYGGDTDTNACIVGSMAEALYGIDDYFDICTTPEFKENMRKFCGEYFQVDHINGNSVYLSSIDDNKRTQDVEKYEFPMESLIW